MLLIIGEDFQILHLISVHESGLCDDFDFMDGADSYRDVWEFESLNIGGSYVDWALIRTYMLQLYQASIMAVSLILSKTFDIDNFRGTWAPFKTASWSGDKFKGSAAVVLIGSWEEDVEGIDFFLCECDGYESDKDEDIGDIWFHTFGANL